MTSAWRCPLCSGELPVREMLDRARVIRALFIPFAFNTGIECPACFARLAVVQRWCAVGGIVSIVLGILAIQVTQPVIGEHALLKPVFIIAWTASMFAAFHYLPFWLLRFQPAAPGKELRFPLGLHTEHERKKRDDARQHERDDAPEATLDASEAGEDFLESPAPWNCEACGEQSPREIRICWKCGASAPTLINLSAGSDKR